MKKSLAYHVAHASDKGVRPMIKNLFDDISMASPLVRESIVQCSRDLDRHLPYCREKGKVIPTALS